ncbi:MAG: PaaI family thioesterase [Firmicutes bacterium]|nr:PaaI family thioesterase [Bacillota bacterium]
MTKKLATELLREQFKNTRVNCWDLMKPELVEYVEGKSMTFRFPVLEIYSNPRKSMQGGFISAAFDNSYGPLASVVTGQLEMASVDLCVNYHRPIFENDTLTVKVYIKSKGKNILHLTGEAFDSKDRLIASSVTNIMLLEKEKFHKKPQ